MQYTVSLPICPYMGIYGYRQSGDNDNQAKHFVPWTEYPRPMFPDYCSGVFYIMSGKVKTNFFLEIW